MLPQHCEFSLKPKMKKFAFLIFAVCALSLRAQPANLASSPSAEISPSTVLTTMKLVADWQLAHPSPSAQKNKQYSERSWTYGALYTGIMALNEIAGTPQYHDALVAMGKKFDWQPGPREYHADDHCVSQTYLELYLKDRDAAMLQPTKERFDFILAHPATNDLHMGVKGAQDRWNWCDALFMGPPAWIRLFKVTDEPRYLDFMDKEWRATSDFLYDTNEHLYFRDSTYFDKREANGKKIYWSRGNGWVLAGLARVLEVMPADYPQRKFYEQQFKEMAAKIASLQQEDGLWRASLLDPDSFPLKETSGSGFFTFGIAWGINHGLLERAKFEPAARKAWAALVGCVTPEGKLEHVQPVGADPKKFLPTDTEVYGTGAFLLAGSEMYRLAQREAAK
jgi:unsaturated rhamnogalacturonyl hydrolase